MSYYLVTTADERTWKFDRPVIFLGEWCRLYERKNIWQAMDAIVAAPYGLGQAKKDADYAEARALEEKLFPVLCDVLNHYHCTQNDSRFWKIVLGHWFRRYVEVILNRVRTLELCLDNYQLSGSAAFSVENYTLAPMDSSSAIFAFNDDRWNNALYVRILDLLGASKCPIEIISGDAVNGFSNVVSSPVVSLKQRILTWGYQFVGKFARLLAKEDDAFIANSYLPRKEAIKLQLALGQVPQLVVSPNQEWLKKADPTLRRRLANMIGRDASEQLSDTLRVMLFELLPVCYLESFSDLAKKVHQSPWPQKPKFIFTSNKFDTDEVFKLWTATKVKSGFKYIVGQHGNNYGTSRYLNCLVEELTSDQFLTWGWADGLPQHTPAFILKMAGQKFQTWDPNGGLLLVELCLNHRMTTWDDTHEFGTYFQDQQTFIEKLDNKIRAKLTVRLHGGYRQQRWGDESRWEDFDPDLNLDTGAIPITKIISRSRLIVHSYDSTGILETLSQNIPTLAFWQNGLDHLRDSAKPHYQLLVDAGIVHFSAESVAAKINEIWSDVGGWWTQGHVQEARKKFSEKYAKVSQRPISEINKILLKDIL